MKSILWPMSALVVLASLGCGGSGSGSKGTLGTLSLKVKWPLPSRLIPIDSASIVAIVTDSTGKSLGQQLLAKPTTGNTTTVNFTNLPAGPVTLGATAYPTATGTGVAQALGSAPATIVAAQTAQVTVTMQDTIVKVVINPASPMVNIGSTANLTMTAFDATNEVVLTSPTTTQWTSGTKAAATVSATGVLTGVSTGTSLITVKETESGVSGTTTATVAAAQPFEPVNVVTDKTGKFTYGIDQLGLIHGFSIGTGGQLSPLSAAPANTGGTPATFEGFGGGYNMLVGTGNVLYAVVEHSSTFFLVQYSIGTNGQLTPLSPATVPLPAGTTWDTMFTDPSGKFVYVQVAGGGSSLLRTFSVGANGALTQVGTDVSSMATISAANPVPNSNYIVLIVNGTLTLDEVQSNGTLDVFAQVLTDFVENIPLFVDPAGHFAYAQSKFKTGTPFELFRINQDGTLSDVGPAISDGSGVGEDNFVATPDGKFFVRRTTGSMSVYSVALSGNSQGVLTLLGTQSVPSMSNAYDPLAITPNGQFVYSPDAKDLRQYSLSSSGALTPLVPPTVP